MITKELDKFKGCILGLTIGDALGFPVEFVSSRQEILKNYKTTYHEFIRGPNNKFPGQYSDDTEMTIYVIQALMNANSPKTKDILDSTANQFANWYHERDLSRAPGVTCSNACYKITQGTHWSESGKNNSKGCGTVMRSAPYGLFFNDKTEVTKKRLFEITGKSSLMTHGNEVATTSAIANALIISYALNEIPPERWLKLLLEELKDESKEFLEIVNLIPEALSFKDPYDGVDLLGEGWVGEEAFAIALFAMLHSPNDFKEIMRLAIVHKGDSDSTGSIAGGFYGAYHGVNKLPKNLVNEVEGSEYLLNIAEKFYMHCINI